MQTVIDQALMSISNSMNSYGWLVPILALLAGILTSFTPCSLSSIPLIIGYVSGASEKNIKKALRLSLVFSAGMAVTFTVLGTLASLLGMLFMTVGPWWYILLGIMMLLMALQTWGVYDFIPSTYAITKNKRRGYIGAFLAGILGGLFSTPCATPVLIALLAFVAQEGNLLRGVVLLLIFSIGRSFLVILIGTSIGLAQKISSSSGYGKISIAVRLFLGSVIALLAFYLFYLGF